MRKKFGNVIVKYWETDWLMLHPVDLWYRNEKDSLSPGYQSCCSYPIRRNYGEDFDRIKICIVSGKKVKGSIHVNGNQHFANSSMFADALLVNGFNGDDDLQWWVEIDA